MTEIVPSLDLFPELIEEEEAFEIFREQQFATIARRHKDGGGGDHPGGSSRGFRNNLSRLVNADIKGIFLTCSKNFLFQSEEVTYAQLTLPRGGGTRGYSPMVKQSGQGTIYAKIDNSRSLFSGLLSPSSSSTEQTRMRTNACFSGPGLVVEEDQEDTMTPLVGNKSVVVTRGPLTSGHQGPPEASVVRITSASSARESKV